VFHQLTFRRGMIWSARFAPDGQTIVYGAAWDGKPFQLFSTRPVSRESRSLGLPDGDILSISPSGEMAGSLGRTELPGSWTTQGTLARVPLAGGAPREVLENVQDATWSPDGSRLAIVRAVAGRSRLEFPAGKVLYETDRWISHPRFSPKGNEIAFLDHPVCRRRQRPGGRRRPGRQEARAHRPLRGSAGSGLDPRRRRTLVYTASEAGTSFGLRAVTTRGSLKIRVVERIPGRIILQDILRDARVLLTRDTMRPTVLGVFPGETA
jgi:Tol biopolymer transport system component